MRILVVSDTHGNLMNLRKAVLAQPTAEIIVHLGDGEEEVWSVKKSFPEKTFYQVKGNCDWASALPVESTILLDTPLGRVKIFYTHGHLYGVKSGLYQLVCSAREQKATVVLFGHTHQPLCDYEDGLYLLNPGSLTGYKPTYGTLDITPQGIVTNTIELM